MTQYKKTILRKTVNLSSELWQNAFNVAKHEAEKKFKTNFTATEFITELLIDYLKNKENKENKKSS